MIDSEVTCLRGRSAPSSVVDSHGSKLGALVPREAGAMRRVQAVIREGDDFGINHLARVDLDGELVAHLREVEHAAGDAARRSDDLERPSAFRHGA